MVAGIRSLIYFVHVVHDFVRFLLGTLISEQFLVMSVLQQLIVEGRML